MKKRSSAICILPIPEPRRGTCFFPLLLTLLFFLPMTSPADPGFLFLEPGPEMRRSGGGNAHGGGHGSGAGTQRKKEGQDTSENETHSGSKKTGMKEKGEKSPMESQGKGHPGSRASEPEKGEKKEREKRAAMSHPAHYTLLLGWPPAIKAEASKELLRAETAILRPDLSREILAPEKEGPAIRIRDAALIQGTYHISAALEKTDDVGRIFRLFTTASMRNTGEKTDPPEKNPEAALDVHLPWFSMEDLSPDPGKNFARVHRKYTGDTLPLRIRLGGIPVPDLPVTLTTAEGWQQTLNTDEAGLVTFVLIKERFHGKGVNKAPITFYARTELNSDYEGHRQLIKKARAKTGEEHPAGKSEILRTSLALPVHPTPLDWESRAAGFYTLILTGLAIGLGTAIRRRKRRGRWF
ncbi:DUF4198 domain-containing protein [Desulfobotulus mexicanus]|uniref:DUF4198 domain-containing protein n=1 Tax=Desulfobotulus mexicanus TaxID=2586642 RepID=A0A5Q4VJ94_9BACT|nr:DUF4198 domain-containing protein [Desulfobotulus mexicanus]TYT76041.1 DUF4198 domain-containing protein [Desulfobotulus mexicanus]